MALVNCPQCAVEISDTAVACPNCGFPAAPLAAPANADGNREDGTSFSGSVFGFGIWKCISLESHSFWWRGTDNSFHDTKYSASITKEAKESPRRINKTKGQLIRIWLLGLLGTFGFQHFAVGRILTGSIRFLLGVFWWFMIILMAFFNTWDAETPGVLRVFFVALFIPPAIDIIKISLGRFRDVFKKYIT